MSCDYSTLADHCVRVVRRYTVRDSHCRRRNAIADDQMAISMKQTGRRKTVRYILRKPITVQCDSRRLDAIDNRVGGTLSQQTYGAWVTSSLHCSRAGCKSLGKGRPMISRLPFPFPTSKMIALLGHKWQTASCHKAGQTR